MTRRPPSWIAWLAAAAVLAAMAGFVAARIAHARALAGLEVAAQRDAVLRAALLDSEIARFRLLPLALTDDRDVVRALAGTAGARAALNRKLEALAAGTGASAIYVIGRDGIAIAASNWRTRQSFVGSDYGFRRYVRDARAAGQASQFALGTVSGRPGLYLSRANAAGGVVVVKLEFDRVERAWARAGGTTLVTGAAGVVLVTSRPAWRFATTRPLAPTAAAEVRAEARLGGRPFTALPLAMRGGRPVLDGVRVVRADATARQPGWTLSLFRPSAPARAAGWTAGLLAALIGAALVALAWGVRLRMALGRRRTAELEQAVGMRTAELRREIDERTRSEARAAELREGLRQANRLATLGQVTASVAHETAQPVAAIRTYADAGRMLLARGDTDAVADNLSAIARLTDRIGAVTTELRGFARRRAGDLRPVPLADVVDGARLILKDQLRRVMLTADPIDRTLAVMGGRVRLEQVLVNLMQNAIEAMAGMPEPALGLTLSVGAETVALTVTDTGPGISDAVAERLFTPFVTSRPDGLGLGLVIAQDIMVDMGGSLIRVPADRGAAFRIVMPRA